MADAIPALGKSSIAQRVGGRTPGIVLALLCAMYFILYVDRVNISTAAPLIQADLGISNVELAACRT